MINLMYHKHEFTKKWTPQRAKEESRKKIIDELVKAKKPLRWNQLLSETKISSKTLKNALADLEKTGVITRTVKPEEGYPPPVYYEIVDPNNPQIKEALFESQLSGSYLFPIQLDNVQIKEKDGMKILGLTREIPSTIKTDDAKEYIEKMGRRIAAMILFCSVKTLSGSGISESGETILLNAALNENHFLYLIDEMSVYEKDGHIKYNLKIDSKMYETVQVNDGIALGVKEPTYKILNQLEQNIFDKILREVYPEEMKELEKLENQAHSNAS